MNAKNSDSSCQLFKNLKILPLKSQYISSLLLFVAKNRDLYESNSEIHNISTRFSSDLHTATANLTTFQKIPFYFGVKVFNHLPTTSSIKNTSHDINQFRCLKKFPSYKLILLTAGIFCLEFQQRSWLSVIILVTIPTELSWPHAFHFILNYFETPFIWLYNVADSKQGFELQYQCSIQLLL